MATKKATKKVKKSTKAAASTGSSTVVGIKLSGIDKIVSSIDNYKKAVSAKTHVAANNANIQKAIKGTTSEANIKQMLQLINSDMKGLLVRLDQYKGALQELKTSYKTNDTNNATFVNTYKRGN
jgi:hypothetical protein